MRLSSLSPRAESVPTDSYPYLSGNTQNVLNITENSKYLEKPSKIHQKFVGQVIVSEEDSGISMLLASAN